MRRFLAMLESLHDRLTSAFFVLAQFCLFVIVFSYSYETVSRYFFAAPTWWSNQIVAYALCIGTFLALPHVTREGLHIAITFLVEILPPRSRGVVITLTMLVGAVVCLIVGWICLRSSVQQFARHEMLMQVRPVQKAWISSWIPLGFLSAAIHLFRLAVAGAEKA
jgi:TRAP-type C4-dicarboxylate transport system permease small subunit